MKQSGRQFPTPKNVGPLTVIIWNKSGPQFPTPKDIGPPTPITVNPRAADFSSIFRHISPKKKSNISGRQL